MLFNPPPPSPANTRPITTTHASFAIAETPLPSAKRKRHQRKPERRPKMSVTLPESGCTMVRAIRYAEARVGMRAEGEDADEAGKDEEMARAKVEVMVESSAARKEPIQVRRMTVTRRGRVMFLVSIGLGWLGAGPGEVGLLGSSREVSVGEGEI